MTKAELKEKELVADDREEGHVEKEVADAGKAPETTPEQRKGAAGEPERAGGDRDKEVKDRNKPETDGKKKSEALSGEKKRKLDKTREKDTRHKQEKDENHNETKNKTPQNKTFASFQRGR